MSNSRLFACPLLRKLLQFPRIGRQTDQVEVDAAREHGVARQSRDTNARLAQIPLDESIDRIRMSAGRERQGAPV